MQYSYLAKLKNKLSNPLRVVIEPWATEYFLAPNQGCEVIALSRQSQPSIELEIADYGAIFWIDGKAATFEFWQDGKLVESL